MEMKYLEYIRKFLDESVVMVPEPTAMIPRYRHDPSIRAVIFDIYGTIIISESGDIEESDISVANLKKSLDASGIVLQDSANQDNLVRMLEIFRNEIMRVHMEERSENRPFPEVDILKIWETIVLDFMNKGLLSLNDPLCIKCFTFVFEMLSNNIYPMPGMKEVIGQLEKNGMPLGIISNAQFYTPVILNYFLNDSIAENEDIRPFDPELTIFSYRHMRSKPDNYLFELMKKTCREKYNIPPSAILFLGNDMFRDIYPASQAGFKTALFAGDKRSLRLRNDNPLIDGISPDYVVTDLKQLLKIIN